MMQITDTSESRNFLSVASEIGRYLSRTALWDSDRCNWIGSAAERINNRFELVERSFSSDLYSGTSGIALFLATLLDHEANPIVEQTLEGAIKQVLGRQTGEENNQYGYYAGELGIACCLICVGEKRQNKEWEQKGWDALRAVLPYPMRVGETDVIAGVAGAIPRLLRLFRKSNETVIRDTLIRCGNFLIEQAVKTEYSWSWMIPGNRTGLTGYSHGAAGIATALLELYFFCGNKEYLTGAMMGYAYERAQFNPQLGNWPDLRDFNLVQAEPARQQVQLSYGESWCHGAPGIAISRLRAWQLTGDPAFRNEAEVALATTHRMVYHSVTDQRRFANFSLCHGLAGNADILLLGSLVLDNPVYSRVACDVGNYGLNMYHRNGIIWPSGVNDPTGNSPGMLETPGLMLGLAGTGYFYLRLFAPDAVPSVLNL